MIRTETAEAPRSTVHVRLLWAISVALALFVVLYRFNTLGGALGGFDDDHFVPFAYAKQVQAGEQPLRDFTGIGLQGVWPSLTFELSAAAQKLLGDSLRSEAVLSIAGVTAAAVLTYVAASLVAPGWWALAATLLGVFLAPKLYNYPKVVVLSAAALGIVRYAREPSVRRIMVLAVVAAIGFLFRHDYAVYVGVGVLFVCVFAGAGMARAAGHLLLFAIVSTLLLLPSIVFVERHGGLAAYVRDSVASTEQESNRTQLRRPTFTSRDEDGRALGALTLFEVEQNAVAWLYYLHYALPVLVLLRLWQTRPLLAPGSRRGLAALSVMTIAVAAFVLRGNTGARFGDMAPLFSVLLAGGVVLMCRRGMDESALSWLGRCAIAGVAVAATTQSVFAVGGVRRELDTSGWSDSVRKVIGQAQRRWIDLGALPARYWHGTPESPSIAAVQYLNRCTQPTDRVLVLAYQPELITLADRRFAAGRASVIPGLLTDESHQRLMVERWRRQSVPVVLVEEDDEYAHEIPVLHRYLTETYAPSGKVEVNGGGRLTVFARRDIAPAGTFNDLPCFR